MEINKTDKVGRNDPCPCGSGKKHKKCCLPKQDFPSGKNSRETSQNLTLQPKATDHDPDGKLRNDLGQAYGRIKLLSKEEAVRWMEERDKLVRHCLDRGAKRYEGNLNKLYTGEMSPGRHCCAE